MLQQEALNRGLKVQKMLEEAISHYLGQAETTAVTTSGSTSRFSELSPEEQRWLEALLNYLRDDSKPFKENLLAIMGGALGLTPEEVSRKSKRKTG